MPVADVRFVADLYPRKTPSDEMIGRYQDVIDQLPPITVARDGVLVDGYHRWQAHLRAGAESIAVEHLGDLTDVEILNESIRRNATHGQQLTRDDKRANAERLWPGLGQDDRIGFLADLLGVSRRTVEQWTQDVRKAERDRVKAEAWDRWLNCETQEAIADTIGEKQQTVSDWLTGFRKAARSGKPPDPQMAWDVWQYGQYKGDNDRFGKMHPGVVDNLLWLYTESDQIVVDPFAGAGTTIERAKAIGRRVWASDLSSAAEYPLLPIHTHDITTGWPDDAPRKANLILLDPPYWMQAAGRYSDDPADLGNMPLDEFMAAWSSTVKVCAEHVDAGGHIAFIVSPAQVGTLASGHVVDLAHLMYNAAEAAGLTCERRIIVPYSTQQATGQQLDAAREHRKLLKLYRDLVVLR
jgi:DNA-binding transcriptional regulator YdaS (Cro superfamily)